MDASDREPAPDDAAQHAAEHLAAQNGEAPDAPDSYACPHCGQPVHAEPEALAPFLNCPWCGEEFSLPGEVTPEDQEALDELRLRHESREQALDSVRIKQLAALRRSYIRSRSHIIIGMVLCIAICGELIFAMAKRTHTMHRVDIRSVGYLLFAAAALIAAAFFWGRAVQMTRELDRPRNNDPATPPDFSPLRNGRDWDQEIRGMQGRNEEI